MFCLWSLEPLSTEHNLPFKEVFFYCEWLSRLLFHLAVSLLLQSCFQRKRKRLWLFPITYSKCASSLTTPSYYNFMISEKKDNTALGTEFFAPSVPAEGTQECKIFLQVSQRQILFFLC